MSPSATATTTTAIHSVTLEVPDLTAARAFYDDAFVLGPALGLRASESSQGSEGSGASPVAEAPSSGFRGFTLSLVVSQPGTVDALIASALDAGATELKPVRKSFWGYGGVVRAPDGAIWKVATSARRDSGPPTREVDEFVLLLGVADVGVSRSFYVERGLHVAKSFARRYVQFDTGPLVTLALYGRRALAKDAGVEPAGSGAPRLSIGADLDAFTDPDGFAWEPAVE
jgi:catechol 2,3-dioxygenase-like lactoylglutathione lyase family enzyme